MVNIFRMLFAFLFFSVLSPDAAHAYIDPGIGSMLLQGLAAGLITFLVFWRGLIKKISSFFSKGNKENKEKNSDDS